MQKKCISLLSLIKTLKIKNEKDWAHTSNQKRNKKNLIKSRVFVLKISVSNLKFAVFDLNHNFRPKIHGFRCKNPVF